MTRCVTIVLIAMVATVIALVGSGIAAEPASGLETSGLGASSHAATGVEGLQVESSTLYRPQPQDGHIEVESTYTMTNLQPDELIDGAVRSFFYTKWVIAVPDSVSRMEARSGGTELRVAIEPVDDSPGIAFATIDLPFELTYDQTVTVDVTYLIPGGQPREGAAGARVNDSFLSFSVWAVGDPGRTDIRIEIPAGFIVDLQGDLDVLQERPDPETPNATVLEALDIAEPERFFGQVYGRDDGGLITRNATLPAGGTATVRAWPDDPEWADFVVDAIVNDIPVLEDLIGLEWPAGDIEVIETVTPYLLGYGGWFNASSGVIEIGEALERDVILHELGHAWFNESLVGGRWITEGLTEEFARQTIQATGNDIDPPTEPDLNDPIRVPLAEWASPWSLNEDDAFAYEAYHYNAAWWVVHRITQDIGTEAMSEVLVALDARESAYPGDVPLDPAAQAPQWTHFYDLLERRTDAVDLETLFRTYVLAERDHDVFDERRAALEQYDRLATQGGAWSPPVGIRQSLGSWDFTGAEAQIARALQTLEERAAVEIEATGLGVELDLGPFEAAFEAARSDTELDATQSEVRALGQRLRELRNARRELEAQATALGATIEFGSLTLEEAELDIRGRRQALDDLSELRTQVESTAEVLGVVPPPWTELGDGVDFDAATSLAQARLSTLEAIAGAEFAIDRRRSLVERIGLLADDPEAELTVARAAFEADRLDESIAASARATAEIAQASAVGASRIRWSLITLVVLLMAAFLLAHRRRITRAVPPVLLPPDRPPPEPGVPRAAAARPVAPTPVEPLETDAAVDDQPVK